MRQKQAPFYSELNAQSDELCPSIVKPEEVVLNLKKNQTAAEKRRHTLSIV